MVVTPPKTRMETSPRNRLETGSAFVFSAASEYRTGSTSFQFKKSIFLPKTLGITNLDFRFDTNKREKTSWILCDEKDRHTNLLFLRPLIRRKQQHKRENREIQLVEMKILCINISARGIQKTTFRTIKFLESLASLSFLVFDHLSRSHLCLFER